MKSWIKQDFFLQLHIGQPSIVKAQELPDFWNELKLLSLHTFCGWLMYKHCIRHYREDGASDWIESKWLDRVYPDLYDCHIGDI